ncbi:hypothetical protein [Paenibacillus mendelii]|uniref:Uncharacterized protein n=1 Tax=Paenibacillus mendelii TaxID=206163 RepID=A0ABV6JJP9_9BACL|nr:hypothetical protein [Paenibacillus mendelii]MCQ6559074.1 hypothetical protein [Paenibacillus mendelii]
MLREAYRRLNRNLSILLYPIILDMIALGAGWGLAGFRGEPQWSLKLLLDMGLPSLSHSLNLPVLANTLGYLSLFGQEGSVPAVIVVLLLLLVLCYAQGGYIASLQLIASGAKPSFSQFMRSGRVFFVRFFMFNAIVFAAQMGLTLGLSALFGSAGLFFSLLVFIVLRIIFIYIEFTMVVDRLSWDQVLGQSRAYFRSSLAQTGMIVVVLVAGSGLISLLLHRTWSLAAIIIGIPVYAYVITGIQLALMMVLLQTKSQA